MFDDVSIIGAGRVGLTYGCCLASRGIGVHLYEKAPAKFNLLSKRKLPFYEPKLGELLSRVLDNESLHLARSAEEAVEATDVTFVAVGTPSTRSGQIDLAQIREATLRIGARVARKSRHHIVVVQSTVIPGTTVNVIKPMLEKLSSKQAGKGFGLVMQPEFLREGNAVGDVFHPNRIVIGAIDVNTEKALVALWKRFYRTRVPPIVRTTPTTAEMIKYASNAFLATKISFINEIANLCERTGQVDVTDVARGIGLDPRIGSDYLGAGIGFGGSCLPKDLAALISHSLSIGFEPSLLKTVQDINRKQPNRAVTIAKGSLRKLVGRKVAVLGLAFKPNTDDLRDSPAVEVVRLLLQEGCKVSVFDPQAQNEGQKILGARVIYAEDAYKCVEGADCCFVCTSWEQFTSLNLRKLAHLMKTPLIFDGRRVYNSKQLPEEIQYLAIGASRERFET